MLADVEQLLTGLNLLEKESVYLGEHGAALADLAALWIRHLEAAQALAPTSSP